MATSPHFGTVVVGGRRFTVTLEQDPEDGWWIGLVRELPGCGSQGTTLGECREMVADAIHDYLVSRGDVPSHAEEAAQGGAV